MMIDRDFSLPEQDEAALTEAVKKILNSVLNFEKEVLEVKKEFVDKEPVKRKSAGVGWSYTFNSLASYSKKALFFNARSSEEQLVFDSYSVLSVVMVIRRL
jgi:hypothetical protein